MRATIFFQQLAILLLFVPLACLADDGDYIDGDLPDNWDSDLWMSVVERTTMINEHGDAALTEAGMQQYVADINHLLWILEHGDIQSTTTTTAAGDDQYMSLIWYLEHLLFEVFAGPPPRRRYSGINSNWEFALPADYNEHGCCGCNIHRRRSLFDWRGGQKEHAVTSATICKWGVHPQYGVLESQDRESYCVSCMKDQIECACDCWDRLLSLNRYSDVEAIKATYQFSSYDTDINRLHANIFGSPCYHS